MKASEKRPGDPGYLVMRATAAVLPALYLAPGEPELAQCVAFCIQRVRGVEHCPVLRCIW